MSTWNVAMSLSNLLWWPVAPTVQMAFVGVTLLLAIGALTRRKAARAR